MTTTAVEWTPYSTVAPLDPTAQPLYLPGLVDAQRVASYDVYKQIYWDVPNTFQLVQRGTDSQPIYVPTARTIVDTTNRYVGKGIGWVVEPALGDDIEAQAMTVAASQLFRREAFPSKFNTNKRDGLIKGDFLFHIVGDPVRPQGSRISILEVDPGSYFPIEDPSIPGRIIGCYLIDVIIDGSDTFVRRQTYTRGNDPFNNDGSDTSIWSETTVHKPENWQNLDDPPVKTEVPLFQLPAQITAIPVYHFPNIEEVGNLFGSSDLRGFERIMAAVNQGISDQELALALGGLGVYATDAGRPVDPETGQQVNWRIGPGSVVEHAANTTFERIQGVTNLQQSISHLDWLMSALKQGSGTPDVAIGSVDVSVAESGIALEIKMGPMLSKVDERNTTLNAVLMQMFYGLKGFWSAYEGLTFPNALLVPTFEGALPVDRSARIKEILSIADPTLGIASANWARAELTKLGFVFGADEADQVLTQKQMELIAADPFAARVAGELGFLDQADTGVATP